MAWSFTVARIMCKAEQEFSSALNFDAGPAKEDAAAWRHMAAVASGACGASATLLEQSLDRASSYFPKDEAEALVKRCSAHAISEVVHPSSQVGRRAGCPQCAKVLITMAGKSVNKVILLGHLGKDAETKFTPSGRRFRTSPWRRIGG